MRRKLATATTFFALTAACLGSAYGQQPAPQAQDDHQLVLQLLQRVNELEAEVRELKGAAVERPVVTPAVLTASASPAATPMPMPRPQVLLPQGQTSTTQNTDPTMTGMPNMNLPEVAGIQFRGFTDVGFSDTDARGAHSGFSTGAFNLFMTSRLSDKFSVLGELLFEFDPGNTNHPDLERAEFHYTPSDYFNLTAGRFHTAIGYYNTAYHHASWLLPTATRPLLFAFEDSGGVIPTHNVGISATGAIPSGPLGLHYEAELGNGRASSSSSAAANVQVFGDENSRKSYNFAAFARPPAIPGLQTGFSIYGDKLYPVGVGKFSEYIMDAYVSYHPSGFEFTAEGLEIRHARLGTNTVFHTPGFYAVLLKSIGHGVKPYVSWEYVNFAKREPFYGASVGLRHGPSTGIRYDFTDYAAFKLEYFKLIRRTINDVNGVRADLAFTF